MRKKALITGASRGIGSAVAIELARKGYDVGINYNSSKDAALTVQELVRKEGAESVLLKANVGNLEEINKMFDVFISKFGRIDLLINNAGISTFKPFLQVTEEMWDKVTHIDWKGSYFCAQRAAQYMIKEGIKGVILNLSSNQKDGCWPTASVYGPTKAAITKFTQNAALELAPYGIRVAAIAPGYTDVGWPKDDPIHEAADKIPLKRFAQTDEIAKVIAHLVSDEFSYMTGSCLDIDGGALLPVITENDLSTDWSSTNVKRE